MKLNIKTAAVLSIMSLALLLNGCNKNELQIDTPGSSQLNSAGLEGVKQTDELEGEYVDNMDIEKKQKSEEYVLSEYNIDSGNIEYIYTESDEQKKNITVTARKMNEQEYEEQLPVGETVNAIINGNQCTFISRTVHYVPYDYVPTERVKANVQKGTTEIKYGSGTEQLLPIQKMYWYDYENQIGYCAEVMGQYYSLEDWSSFVQSYMENAE